MWITSITQATTHGVYGIDVPPPALIQATATGRVALVAQFPWGPTDLTEISQADAKDLYAPRGMNRLSTGYLSLLAKAFPDLVIARVLGTAAAAAEATLDDGGTDVMTVAAKYKGVAGNSLVATVANASDGDANHFNLTVTISGATGAQSETIANINISGTGTDSYPSVSADFVDFLLIGSLTKIAAGRPDNGTYTFNESTLVDAAEPAVKTGTVVLTSGALFGVGGTLDGLTLIVTSDTGAATTTFNAPANAAAVASQITSAAAGKYTASIDGSTHLVITSATDGEAGTLLIGAGTANSALGFTGAATATGTDATYTGDGADGTINAAAYTTAMDLLASDKSIRHVIVDDCGSGLRSAVNAGLVAHATSMGDRCVYLNGPAGVAAAATVRTDAATYSSVYAVYCDPWVYIYDDTTGSEQLVPSASFAASVASQLPPSTSIAWKADTVQQMLGGIIRLEYNRGVSVGGNTTAGVATFIREENAGHSIEAGVLTVAPANPAKKNHTRTQMGIYILSALRRSLRPYTDAPNVRATWDQIYPPIQAFLEGLKRNSEDPAVALLPHIVDYGLGSVASANRAADIQAGDLRIPLQVKLSAGIERLVFLIQYGQTVSVSLQQ